MPYIRSQSECGEIVLPARMLIADSITAAMMAEADPRAGEGRADLAELYREGCLIVQACIDAGQSCSVGIFAVDHPARLMEQYGVDPAEALLDALARHFHNATLDRPHLVRRLSRYEFAIVIAGLDGDAAFSFCDELRAAAAGLSIDGLSGPAEITCSAGLAEVHGPETFDNYLNAAEQFLFMARRNGRNRVFSTQTMLKGLTA